MALPVETPETEASSWNACKTSSETGTVTRFWVWGGSIDAWCIILHHTPRMINARMPAALAFYGDEAGSACADAGPRAQAASWRMGTDAQTRCMHGHRCRRADALVTLRAHRRARGATWD